MLHFLPLISFRNFKMAFMGGHYVVVAFRGRVFDGSGSFGGGDDKSSLNFLIMLDAVCVCRRSLACNTNISARRKTLMFRRSFAVGSLCFVHNGAS